MTALAEEFKRPQDTKNEALAALTDQMAALAQSIHAVKSAPTENSFGLTAMSNAGIAVPDLTWSVLDVKADLGMVHQ